MCNSLFRCCSFDPSLNGMGTLMNIDQTLRPMLQYLSFDRCFEKQQRSQLLTNTAYTLAIFNSCSMATISLSHVLLIFVGYTVSSIFSRLLNGLLLVVVYCCFNIFTYFCRIAINVISLSVCVGVVFFTLCLSLI